jgi:hypothetical protein
MTSFRRKMMGFAAAQPILRHLFDPNSRLVAVDELDAGFFERLLNGFDGARLQTFAGLQPYNRVRSDLGHGCKLAHVDVQRGARHTALLGIYHVLH